METIQRFLRHSLLSYRALFGWLDPKVYILVMVGMPLSQLLFFSFLVKHVYDGVDLAGYIGANALLLCVMNSVFGITSVITSDRSMGTLQLVMAAPANKPAMFLARSLAHVANGLFTACIGLIFGILLFDISITLEAAGALALVWAVSIFSACGLGLIIGSFCLWTPSMHLLTNLLASILLLLSGANYPQAVMPHALQFIAQFMPLTRGVKLTKEIMNEGNYERVLAYTGQEFLLGIVFFIMCIGCIRFAAYQARVKGTMELS
ncbi:ABC transporter permease [Bacillus sp. FJAT-27445]|uniref:ABC transporter permease n=1 Tax=Bacillus sp. FJAT-27445 TaxID=1679166 RepID=UPI000743BA8F|nr:ABC transporter permease [Bacillus sp. FJAT-27445]